MMKGVRTVTEFTLEDLVAIGMVEDEDGEWVEEEPADDPPAH